MGGELDVECGEGDKKANEHVIIEKKSKLSNLTFQLKLINL